MAEIFKNKGSSLDCTAFRDVMVSDAPASQYHAWIRALVNPYFEQGSRNTQFGSRKLRATAQAAHCVRGWLKLCRMRGSSGAVLFLDVISAFDEVMRELFLGGPPTDDSLAAACKRLGWKAWDFRTFREAAGKCSLADLGLHPHVSALLEEAHRGHMACRRRHRRSHHLQQGNPRREPPWRHPLWSHNEQAPQRA